ncbi:MAG: hypothetical protein HZB68_03895 [Candidatus Aenigmarchaeota archaeon]|nr:hypothetical protein [Candidatus Aenigmarchaeota archaeon]
MSFAEIAFQATGIVTPVAALLVWFTTHKTIISLSSIPKEKKLKISAGIFIFVIGWLALANAFGRAGLFAERNLTLLVWMSNTLGAIADALPNHWIIGVQIYRLLGVVFLFLYRDGLMPGEFALPSGIGDIAVGITAPLVAFLFLTKNKHAPKAGKLWNYIGIADLVLALIMGALTAPTLLQSLSFDLPNTLIISYPLVTIPTFAVPFAFLLHLISLRLLKK